MLRDMTDSKRIDQHVQTQQAVSASHFFVHSSELTKRIQSIIHPTIISRHFWPALESSDIAMPGQFEKYVEALIFLITAHLP